VESGGKIRSTVERPIQVAWLDPAAGDGAAVKRAVIRVDLRRREDAPAVRAGERPWPVARWFCVPAERGFLGLAILEVGPLPAGPCDFELALRRRRERRRLVILRPASEGSPASPNASEVPAGAVLRRRAR